MIWLFRINEVFWDNEPKVNEHYLFDANDIEFSIPHYEISLYFPTANYYVLSDSNPEEIYQLRYAGNDGNPTRALISKDDRICNVIRGFYINETQQRKD